MGAWGPIGSSQDKIGVEDVPLISRYRFGFSKKDMPNWKTTGISNIAKFQHNRQKTSLLKDFTALKKIKYAKNKAPVFQ